MFLLVVAVSLWRILHREAPAEWPLVAEPVADPRPIDLAEDPLVELARGVEERQNGHASHASSPQPFDHRYAVKWTDRSEDVQVRRERRDLTLDDAVKDAGWMIRHSRRFYPGARSSRSPFAELKVYLQCLCGRDVPDPTSPHTIPGQDRVCPWSAPGRSTETVPSLLTTLQ